MRAHLISVIAVSGLGPTCVMAAPFCEPLPLATFDGAPATTKNWATVNDPVMGGQSRSNLTVDAARGVAVWKGDVKIVPFLGAPGFCNIQAPPLGRVESFPDCTGLAGITINARRTDSSGLSQFRAMLGTTGATHGFQQGQYTSGFVFTDATGSEAEPEWQQVFLPWSSFHCEWRGQNVTWCPKLDTQLAEINSIAIGTYYPLDAPGAFALEIKNVAAGCGQEILVHM